VSRVRACGRAGACRLAGAIARIQSELHLDPALPLHRCLAQAQRLLGLGGEPPLLLSPSPTGDDGTDPSHLEAAAARVVGLLRARQLQRAAEIAGTVRATHTYAHVI
jgi:hypothetical protein